MKKNVRNYYHLRVANSGWGTGYYSYNVNGAIKLFLNDPLYDFQDGSYEIEVRDYPNLFKVVKKTKVVKTTKITIKKA
jgi:hypothetical protein